MLRSPSYRQREPEWARGQLVAWLFGAFAALALALASVGLYSVVAYTAVQRTNEFGIRIALGANRGHVLGIVFRSTVVSVGAGMVAGVVLTLALNRVLAAYNAGSAAVDRSNGPPPFQETQNYIRSVLDQIKTPFDPKLISLPVR